MAKDWQFGNGSLRSAFINRYLIFMICNRVVQKLLWHRAVQKKQ